MASQINCGLFSAIIFLIITEDCAEHVKTTFTSNV